MAHMAMTNGFTNMPRRQERGGQERGGQERGGQERKEQPRQGQQVEVQMALAPAADPAVQVPMI